MSSAKIAGQLLAKGEVDLAQEVLALEYDFTENKTQADNDSAKKLDALRQEMLEGLRKTKGVLQGVYNYEARLKAATWISQLESILNQRGAMAATASDLYQQLT
ncbi:MAG: hypothetical protein WC895_02560 [Candidatus Shapirobacteria bacterium]|jgi:hypothetical protein